MLKADHSFMESFISCIANSTDFHELEDNPGYQTIISHARQTGNKFSIQDIEAAMKGSSAPGYGLINLSRNIGAIKNLWEILKEQEENWLAEVSYYTARLFPDNLSEVTIYPVVGYDQGIGINSKVCVNLNSELCHENYKEIISVIIHEVAHTLYESLHGPILDLLKVETCADMKKLLDSLIQYEGVGVFSAEEYRIKHRLPCTGAPIQEDYNNDNAKIAAMYRSYHALSKDLTEGRLTDVEEFFQRGFGPEKLTHRLGYAIFTELNKSMGFDAVLEAVQMPNAVFVREWLTDTQKKSEGR